MAPTKDKRIADDDADSDVELYSQQQLQELLQKAKQARVKSTALEEDTIMLEKDVSELPKLPTLGAEGVLPKSSYTEDLSLIVEDDTRSIPLIPQLPPQPMTDKSGKLLTNREIKQLRKKQSSAGYFELPTPDPSDLPRILREVEAVRLRNALDPKRFYRKEAPITAKNLPKQIAVGTILPSTTPFGTTSSENLTRAERKRTIVDELVDDSEGRRYAKKKFEELQTVHGARGRATLTQRRLARKRKW